MASSLALMAWIIGISTMGVSQVADLAPIGVRLCALCLLVALGLGCYNRRSKPLGRQRKPGDQLKPQRLDPIQDPSHRNSHFKNHPNPISHPKNHRSRFLISCAWACGRFALLLGVLLMGHYYAEYALTQRLALRSHAVATRQVLIYVDRIAINAQADPNRWQHQVWVLDQQAQPVRWRLSYPSHHINPKNPDQWLQLGHYYRVSGEVKAIHGYAVNGVFDQERWWLQQGWMASMQLHSIQALSADQVSALGHADFVQQQQRLPARLRTVIERQRLLWRQQIEQHGLSQHGLMLALLTGDQSLLPHSTQDLFKRLGISHLLAISGPHVLIFALMFCLLCRRLVGYFAPQLYLKLARPYLLLLPFLLCVWLYAAIVGFEIPALRTLLSVSLISLYMLMRQPIAALQLLLLSASLLLLFDPFSILSAAFWLSYGACLMLLRVYQQLPSRREQTQTAAAHLQQQRSAALRLQRNKSRTQRRDPPRILSRRSANQKLHPRLRSGLVYFASVLDLLWVVVLTQWKIFFALLPLLLLIFQQVSYLAPIANMLAIPMIAMLIVPLEVVAAMLSLCLPSIGMLVFSLANVLLQLLMFLLTSLDQGMGNQLNWLALSSAQILCISLAILMSMLPRGVLPRVWIGLCAVAAVMLYRPQTEFDLTVIDVGQGQAIFLQLPEHNLMIDVGGNFQEQQWGVGEQVIIPFLMRRGVRGLDQLILTHLDQDHSGAFESVSRQVQIKQLYSNQYDPRFDGEEFDYCAAGQRWQYGQVRIQVLSPHRDQLASAAAQQNERSCVVYIHVPQAKNYQHFLLMADAGWEKEYQLLRDYPDLKVDVLILGHHGSRHSSSYAFLKQLQPQLAIASAGWNNRYHHPHPLVEARLKALAIPLSTTIAQGSLAFYLNADRQIELSSYRDSRRWLKRDEAIANSHQQ